MGGTQALDTPAPQTGCLAHRGALGGDITQCLFILPLDPRVGDPCEDEGGPQQLILLRVQAQVPCRVEDSSQGGRCPQGRAAFSEAVQTRGASDSLALVRHAGERWAPHGSCGLRCAHSSGLACTLQHGALLGSEPHLSTAWGQSASPPGDPGARCTVAALLGGPRTISQAECKLGGRRVVFSRRPPPSRHFFL